MAGQPQRDEVPDPDEDGLDDLDGKKSVGQSPYISF